MYTLNVYVLEHVLWNVVLFVLVFVIVLYVGKWLLSFIPVIGS